MLLWANHKPMNIDKASQVRVTYMQFIARKPPIHIGIGQVGTGQNITCVKVIELLLLRGINSRSIDLVTTGKLIVFVC